MLRPRRDAPAVPELPESEVASPQSGAPGPPVRWPARVGLLLLMIVLLSLALAPVGQFYLAWVGLVPWMFVVRWSRSNRAAFLWSWGGGSAFFLANMWWLWNVTVPGMFALTIYLGLYWGIAAVIYRTCGLIPRDDHGPSDKPPAQWPTVMASIAVAPIVWCALEWVRGNWSMFGEQGLPWLFVGHTQSPLLIMCQVADIGGAYAVSAWVVMVNVFVFWMVLRRRCERPVLPSVPLVLLLSGGVAVYGAVRMSDTLPIRPGPTVLVVQPNYPQDNTGEKGAPRDEILRFHVQTTRQALAALDSQGRRAHLVAWSETMMPPINRSARELLADSPDGAVFKEAHEQLSRLAAENNVAILAGGGFADGWKERDGYIVPTDRRNSAYFYLSSGVASEKRYDKIHLVPFGEFIPFGSIPPIYRLLVKLGPKYYEDYILTPGAPDAMTVFELDGGARFVVPICFEDLVSPLVARMIRPAPGESPRHGKRADFLLNITNDGWFMGSEMPQHFQAAVFRSIENRVPTARSVNTGVSGFIDSVGRVHDTVPANTQGWSAAALKLDSRVTFYTRHGDRFAVLCAVATGLLIVVTVVRRQVSRRSKS